MRLDTDTAACCPVSKPRPEMVGTMWAAADRAGLQGHVGVIDPQGFLQENQVTGFKNPRKDKEEGARMAGRA